MWLGRHRHERCDRAFQAALAAAYTAARVGRPPVPPAQLALATLLQAYTGVSDAEVVEAATFDPRWHVVLDCLGAAEAPFSTATWGAFRRRLIAVDLDRRLIEQTVQLARRVGGFGDRARRAALDSSPLWGAGRVADTSTLLGQALRKALGMLARQQGWGLAAMAQATGAAGPAGPASRKAALDRDWDDPAARAAALGQVLSALTARETWLDQAGTAAPAAVTIAQQVRTQDVTVAPDGTPTLRRGVAPDRRISGEDGEMRPGRKSRSRRFDGFTRPVLRDLDSGLVRAVGRTAANAPSARVTPALSADLAAQGAPLGELPIDRAHLSSSLVRERGALSAKPGRCATGTALPKRPFLPSIGSRGCCRVRRGSRCPSASAAPGTSRPFAVLVAPLGHAAPPAVRDGACPSIRTSAYARNCAPGSRPRPGGRSCASGSKWSMHWPTSATGTVTVPATADCESICSTCAVRR